jgi:O-acetyl-ADP-ribose deacetylase
LTEVARRNVGGASVVAVHGDITRLAVDVVVNAANAVLQHGAGVAGALASGGGPAVQEESNRWVLEHGPVGPGQAAVTTAGDLPAERIVHVVGPVHRGTSGGPERGTASAAQDNAALLAEAVCAALDAAEDVGATSVAMPAISAGIYGYPLGEATRVIADTVCGWLAAPRSVSEVMLVGYDEAAAAHFAAALSDVA